MKKAVFALILCFIALIWTFVSLSLDSSRVIIIGSVEIWVVIALVSFFSLRTIYKKTRAKGGSDADTINKSDR